MRTVQIKRPLNDDINALGAKSKRRGDPEMQAQRAVVKWLRTVLPLGSVVASIRNEAQPKSRDPKARARFFARHKANGIKAGMPDLFVGVHGHKGLFIEMKAPRGVVSAEQDACQAELRALGFHVGIATNIEEARQVLHDACIATREAFGRPMSRAKVRVEKSRVPADALPW